MDAATAVRRGEMMDHNDGIKTARIVCEWGMQSYKRFHWSKLRAHRDQKRARTSAFAMAHLHNLVCRLENINQTRNVFGLNED